MKLLLSVIICCTVFLGCGTLNPKNAPGNKSKLHVLAFNIHHGAPANSEEINLDAIAEVIRTEKADLVALQEMDKHTKRSGDVNQTKALADKLGMQYYFSKSIDYQGGEYGVAVLSKYPIINSKQITLPNAHPKGEQRTLAYITVKLPDNSKLDFASVHLDLVKENRTDQTQFLVELANKTENPLIIAGDFNGQPQHAEIQRLGAAYELPCQGDCPLTFPSAEPKRTIDYIFSNRKASTRFKPIEYRAIDDQSSDHLPLLGIYEY